MSRYIPGHPTFVYRNMPAGGETAATNNGRHDTQGAEFGAQAKANKGSKGVPIPGAFYE